MKATDTPTNPQKLGSVYKLPEAQRRAILHGSDSARTREIIHAQREKFMARNNGFEFGEQTTL